MELNARNPSQLGNAIYRTRKALDWTQKDLGKEAGVKQSIISNIEAGTHGTRLETIFKILTALNLELSLRNRRRE